MPQANIYLFCVHCRVKFHPNRLGQIFCCTEHGWQYRNLMRMTKKPEALAKLKGQLTNVKILLSVCLAHETTHTIDDFQKLGFQKYYSKRQIEYGYERPEGFYECYGFGVLFSEGEVVVFAPWHEYNPLNMEMS